eukprot:SAG31_NODE_9618_length_1250_cov_1.108601_1_plen_155_part_00
MRLMVPCDPTLVRGSWVPSSDSKLSGCTFSAEVPVPKPKHVTAIRWPAAYGKTFNKTGSPTSSVGTAVQYLIAPPRPRAITSKVASNDGCLRGKRQSVSTWPTKMEWDLPASDHTGHPSSFSPPLPSDVPLAAAQQPRDKLCATKAMSWRMPTH